MKALIRRPGETVLESNGEGIDWNTGAPLTNEAWCGGPYKLVQNYMPPAEDQEASYDEIVAEPEPVVEEDEDEYVVIDGKRYSKKELRALL